MNKFKKGEKVKNGTILKDNFFAKRKEVMAILYEAKKYFPNAPRTEVKIMNGTAGLGTFNSHKFIVIGEEITGDTLVHVVLHELAHTWFKVKHDDNCPLMKPLYNEENARIAWGSFKQYADKYTK